jgi:hypothetical protein
MSQAFEGNEVTTTCPDPASPGLAPRVRAGAGLLPLYAATMLLSAGLLFWIQPMFTKMVLPLLGGAPGVWNTGMMFFQAALLAGYAYAHGLARLVPPARQPFLHLVLLAAGALWLPIGVAAGWTPPPGAWPVPFLIALFAVSIGPPFFAVSATAPLLQAWFARSDHSAAADPYFLYGASNLGSILALLLYPLAAEPLLRLSQQGLAWSGAYFLLMVLIAACGLAARAPARQASPAAAERASPLTRVTWTHRLHWVALSFAPSSLLLGVTAFIATDVASAPLLWIVPLTLYLLSFVIAFARRPVAPHWLMVKAQPFFLIPLAIIYPFTWQFEYLLPLYLITFFVSAIVCHGELARRRPEAGHLTEFYFWMSLGGLLGGVFNALIAPVAFSSIWEFPIAILIVAALRPQLRPGSRHSAIAFDVLFPAALLAILFVSIHLHFDIMLAHLGPYWLVAFLALIGVVPYSFAERPLRFALGLLALIIGGPLGAGAADVLERSRSFFGVYKIESKAEGRMLTLVHGTILHGAEWAEPAKRDIPLTYYNRQGPLGAFFAAEGPARRIGIVGLGTGTIACYRRKQDSVAYYEIDAAVLRLAQDRRYFHFLEDCAPDAAIVLGDARLALRDAPVHDLLIVDAFSSDAIPLHLLTREALQLYLAKLAPEGILLFHISNRHLHLAPVVAALANDAGLATRRRSDPSTPEPSESLERCPSEWIALARLPQSLAFLDGKPEWKPLPTEPDAAVWTDDYSNLVGALRWVHGIELPTQ